MTPKNCFLMELITRLKIDVKSVGVSNPRTPITKLLLLSDFLIAQNLVCLN